MGRKKKLTVDWFPHACNHKRTMFILEQRYGNDGYSFWFKLLEMLGGADGHFLDMSRAENQEYLQAKTRLSWDTCLEILALLSRLEAIDRELWEASRLVWCQNFVDGVSEVYRKRAVALPARPVIPGDHGANPRQTGADLGVAEANPRISAPLEEGEESEEGEEGEEGNSRSGNLAILNALKKAGILTPSPYEVERLACWIEDGMEPGVVVMATEKAALAGKRSVAYIEGILRGWARDGVTTAEQVECHVQDSRRSAAARDSPPKRDSIGADYKKRLMREYGIDETQRPKPA